MECVPIGPRRFLTIGLISVKDFGKQEKTKTFGTYRSNHLMNKRRRLKICKMKRIC